MSSRPTIVYIARSVSQAQEVLKVLLQQEIVARILAGPERTTLLTMPPRPATFSVVVPGRDAERAYECLERWEEESEAVPSHPRPVLAHSERRGWLEWPRCPECLERRQTLCPACQTAGTQFPLADEVEAAVPLEAARRPSPTKLMSAPAAQPLLLCTCCDEPFRPLFYRLCHQCGHQFDSGTRIELAPLDIFSLKRVTIAAVGSFLVMAALAAYFWWLVSG